MIVLQESYFLAFPDYFKGIKHVNRKGISILNYEQFIINLNNHLKDDLPNELNYMRVSLASVKKRH